VPGLPPIAGTGSFCERNFRLGDRPRLLRWRSPVALFRPCFCAFLFMPVAVAGRSPTTFEIKSAHLPLLALRLKTTDLQALDAELDKYYGDKPDFFSGDAVVVDLSALPADEQDRSLDFPALAQLLTRRHLCLMAASDGSAGQMAAAQEFGLAATSDILGRQAAPERPQAAAPAAQPAAPEPVLGVPPGAVVLDQPVRSGQQFYARGRDLVVMAPVNAGAELIADGHIHVYAALRGRAIAGARGWSEARIFAVMMQPQLVSIAGVYRTGEEPLPDSVWGAAASVTLLSDQTGDKLVFRPISS